MLLKKSFLILIVVASVSGSSLNYSACPMSDGEEATSLDLFEEIKIILFDFFDEFTSPGPNPASQPGQGEPPPDPNLGIDIDPRS